MKFLALIVVPLVLLLALLLSSSIVKSSASGRELFKEKLKAVAVSVNNSYNALVDGDWELIDGVLCKGGEPVDNTLIDGIGKQNDIEITLFFGDTRYLTTLKDDSGKRIVGTKVGSKITEDVLKNISTKASLLRIKSIMRFICRLPTQTEVSWECFSLGRKGS